MNIKNKYLIFGYSFVLIVLAVMIFFLVRKNMLNKKVSNVVTKDNAVYTKEFFNDVKEKVEKAKTLKSYESVDNIKLCDYKKDCIKDVFKGCIKGFGLFYTKDGTNILNVNQLNNDNVCSFYVANVEKTGNINCNIKKDKLTDDLFGKIIKSGAGSDFLVSDYKCVLNTK